MDHQSRCADLVALAFVGRVGPGPAPPWAFATRRRASFFPVWRGRPSLVSTGRSSSPHATACDLPVEIWAELGNGERVLCFRRSFRIEPLEGPPESTPYTRTGRHHWESLEPYERWRVTNRLNAKLRAHMRSADAVMLAADAAGAIGISISVVPVYDPPPRFLLELLESIRAQIYDRWQLCLADDASTNPRIREILTDAAARDPRIRVVLRERNGHIVEAINSALDLATGEYVALVDHDDLLPPDALLYRSPESAVRQAPRRRLDLLTDEDKVDDARPTLHDPQLKGAWDPDMAVTHNYTHHLTILRRSGGRGSGAHAAGI